MSEHQAPGYWAVIPAVIRRDDQIPANAKLLYGDLSALTNERGYCYASNEYLMGLYGWSDRTVQRLIAALEERGYIRVEQVQGLERRIYCGIIQATPTPDNFVGGGATKMSGDPRQNCRRYIMNNKTVNNTPPTPQGEKREKSVPSWKPDAFERFWNYYRKHVRGENRAEAVRQWDRLKPSDELIVTMGKALMAQIKSPDWQRGVGIPHACRWIKNRRWEDQIKTPPEDQELGAPEEATVEVRRLPQW